MFSRFHWNYCSYWKTLDNINSLQEWRNTENCFKNGDRPPSWIWENFHFWSGDLYLHV